LNNAADGDESIRSSEWPTVEQVEQAAFENEQWSCPQRATPRYRRFRDENFQRLRKEAARAHKGEPFVDIDDNTDWYRSWSQASNRRRHLDQLDDQEASNSILRRSINPREWKERNRKRKVVREC